MLANIYVILCQCVVMKKKKDKQEQAICRSEVVVKIRKIDRQILVERKD